MVAVCVLSGLLQGELFHNRNRASAGKQGCTMRRAITLEKLLKVRLSRSGDWWEIKVRVKWRAGN